MPALPRSHFPLDCTLVHFSRLASHPRSHAVICSPHSPPSQPAFHGSAHASASSLITVARTPQSSSPSNSVVKSTFHARPFGIRVRRGRRESQVCAYPKRSTPEPPSPHILKRGPYGLGQKWGNPPPQISKTHSAKPIPNFALQQISPKTKNPAKAPEKSRLVPTPPRAVPCAGGATVNSQG